MNKLYTIVLVFMSCMMGCIPGKYEYLDPGFVDMDSVNQIKMRISHSLLLANGKGQIEFYAALIKNDGFQVVDDRTDFSQLEYYTTSGELLSKTYSTSDRSLIGKTIEVFAKIKGRDLVSDTLSFTITDPSPAEAWEEITIPLIFHVVQIEEEIKDYNLALDANVLQQNVDKLNNAFAGLISKYPVGVDTKIRFKLALCDPNGSKLGEPGIHRVIVKDLKGKDVNNYNDFIRSKDMNLLWDPDKYLNIWLISDFKGSTTTTFSMTRNCRPQYKEKVTDSPVPEGSSLSLTSATWTPLNPKHVQEVGMIYRLQTLYLTEFDYDPATANELTNAMGYYLGLVETCPISGISYKPDDYCSDTKEYVPIDVMGQTNKGLYKLADGKYFFMSENIMDDPRGVHRAVSMEQTKRMRWMLRNCPGRYAWKSNFAFTGK